MTKKTPEQTSTTPAFSLLAQHASPETQEFFEAQRETVKAAIARNLELVRTLVGECTQEEFARAVGVSRATINQLEQGRGDPKLSTLVDIATALNISPILLLLSEADLDALIKAIGKVQDSSADQTQDVGHLEKMQRLLKSGLAKHREEAVDMALNSKSVLSMASLGKGTLVGAAIGTTLLPGAGTILGAALGRFMSRKQDR
ncbi:helix-turn-helix domain-containing protein [Thermithiobacillus plumbiphilus]|uniref:Helix-turn-helix domain-containing protein n=1 Tax=Thermithiobacillus plumbiphilus TaxID=1729899 RepID=A0ABU9D7Q9_9PROT